MRLSPLTRDRMFITSLLQSENGLAPEQPSSPAEPIRVVVWECGSCGERYDYEDEAEECCEPEASKESSGNCGCPVCGIGYSDFYLAADCCLWKDIDAPTRWRIAGALEAGSTWAEQLEIT